MRSLAADCRAQDVALREARLDVWIGAEPTFTDRTSQEPPWVREAEGPGKRERAEALLRALVPRLAAAARLLAPPGRAFPGEAAPRFCLGALYRPLGEGEAPARAGALEPAGERPAPGPGERWLAVTPDPGVVEVNLAPAPDLATFAVHARAAYAAAEEVGLSPLRFRWNGEATDSGGGGQLTLGGPTPEASPFFRHARLLPALVRYLNRHPALSYAFAGDCVGSASQGPRPDEGVRELFEELSVALDRLALQREVPSPAELWEALAPLLVDASGNPHRTELNVEKLWNPLLPGRGRLGVVELRALRMPATPERLVAHAALFRAVAARLASAPFEDSLLDFGPELHDRLALPFYLAQDLVGVLADLEAAGFGLGPALAAELLAPPPAIARVKLAGAELVLTPAPDFWPLVGDVASQERAAARTVDASSQRVQVLVHAPEGLCPGQLAANGIEVPLERVSGGTHLAAVRYRAFAPSPGLHPGLAPQDPLVLAWERGGEALRVELHAWRPGGGAYLGLPADAAEAERRRRERVVVRPARPRPARPAPRGRLTLDLRRLPGALPA